MIGDMGFLFGRIVGSLLVAFVLLFLWSKMRHRPLRFRWVVVLAVLLFFVTSMAAIGNDLQLQNDSGSQQSADQAGVNSAEQAVVVIENLPDVADYRSRVPGAIVEVDSEESGAYLVHVYEITDGHTATFNWYTVDKATGSVQAEF